MKEIDEINSSEEEKTLVQTDEANKEAAEIKSEISADSNPSVPSELPQETPEPETKEADQIDGEYNAKNPAPTLDATYFKPIQYQNYGIKTIDEEVEDTRTKFMKKLNGSKVYDFVCLGLMVLAFVAVILVTFLNTNKDLAWVTYVVLGVALVIIIASFVISSIFNKKRTAITNEYLSAYEDVTNGYVISSLRMSDPVICTESKIDDQLIIQAHYFRTINSIQSRAIVEAKRKGYEFVSGEVAVIIPPVSIDLANTFPKDYLNIKGEVYTPTKEEAEAEKDTTADFTVVDLNLNGMDEKYNDKQKAQKEKDFADKQKKDGHQNNDTSTGLFGKFISYGMKVASSEAVIVAFAGDKSTTVLPDYLTGFSAIKISGLKSNIVVYATDISSSEVFFDKEGIDILNSFAIDSSVQSGFLSLNSYGCKIGLNLSDDIMSLPVKPLKSRGSFDSFKNAVDVAFRFFDHAEDRKSK
ncbi:MAG: hypothetical protein WCR67_06085 [Bacilli bacterium]